MLLKNLIKCLKDMELLYGDKAVVSIEIDGETYWPTSISGYMGEKRPNECKDPDIVIIRAK